jgi:hypothetical protein
MGGHALIALLFFCIGIKSPIVSEKKKENQNWPSGARAWEAEAESKQSSGKLLLWRQIFVRRSEVCRFEKGIGALSLRNWITRISLPHALIENDRVVGRRW